MNENNGFQRFFANEGLPYFGGNAPYENTMRYSSEPTQLLNQFFDANNKSSPFGQEMPNNQNGNLEGKKKKRQKKNKQEGSKLQVQEMESNIQNMNPPDNKENDDEESGEVVSKVSKHAWKRNFKKLLLKSGKTSEDIRRKPIKKGGTLLIQV